jgi:hypothetical protein
MPRLRGWHWKLHDNATFNSWTYGFVDLKREMTMYISRQETSDFEKAQMRKELSYAMEILESELKTSISRQEISDFETERAVLERNVIFHRKYKL